jgi:hypothetical protein
MAMIGKLVEAFNISGRGCVVLVDVQSGSCRVGDKLSISTSTWPITGIEMPNYNAEGRRRIADGWKPPLGILLRGAVKSELVELIGQTCLTTDQAGKSA